MTSSFLNVRRAVLAWAAFFVWSGVEARELRVCADPNNRPFSAQDGSGMENKIAQLIGQELGAEVTYTWFAQRRGFLVHLRLALSHGGHGCTHASSHGIIIGLGEVKLLLAEDVLSSELVGAIKVGLGLNQ